VLEGARTEYLGQQRGQLGFNSLNSLGLGLELDSSKYDIFITRTRLWPLYVSATVPRLLHRTGDEFLAQQGDMNRPHHQISD
jgi:hypothetical protein